MVCKKVLIYISFLLLLSTNVSAEIIEDYEIDGISIGDSLLKYFSKKDIKKAISKKQSYKDKSFVRGMICSNDNPRDFCKTRGNFNDYDALSFHIKKKDPEYVLYNIGGIKDYKLNINECFSEKSNITKELKSIFSDARTDSKKTPHPNDKTKKSIVHTDYFYFNDGSTSRVQCYDWSEKSGWTDHLKVTLDHNEYVYWLKNISWK